MRSLILCSETIGRRLHPASRSSLENAVKTSGTVILIVRRATWMEHDSVERLMLSVSVH